MQEGGVTPNAFPYIFLIEGYVKQGDMARAEAVINRMRCVSRLLASDELVHLCEYLQPGLLSLSGSGSLSRACAGRAG
jgi:pentatricopeptide repeat protein